MMKMHHSRGKLISAGALSVALVPFFAMACSQAPDEMQASAVERNRQYAAMTPEERIELLKKRFYERVAAQPTNSIRGTVHEIGGKPIAGAEVKIGNTVVETNENGEYVTVLPLGSYLVTFTHPEYATIQRPVNIGIGEGSVIDGHLLPRGEAVHIDADKGAVVIKGPLSLEFEPGDLAFEDGEPVHGDVAVHVTVIDPRQTDHLLASPAELEGLDAEGNNVLLRSYGMLEVEITQAQRKVQVRPGETVTAKFDVDDGFDLQERQHIPMWHHDTMRGTWVEDRTAEATVLRNADGKLSAQTNLPHFSAWNYDGSVGASCAVMTIPIQEGATQLWLRVMSTDANGNPDSRWWITAPCDVNTNSRVGRCAINVPTSDGFHQEVYYRLEARTNLYSDFTPISATFFGAPAEFSVLRMTQTKAWLDGRGYPTGTWCGQNKFSTIEASGGIDLQLDLNPPLQAVRFGFPRTTSPTFMGRLGMNATGVDIGFQTMGGRERSATTVANADADARNDLGSPRDNCPQNSSAQTDANNNGIGDVCEAWCRVLAGPSASWYDADLDGIDDLCDNNWSVANPAQYIGP